MRTVSVLLLAPVLLGACDDTVFSNGSGADLTGATGYEGFLEVAEASCVSCHAANASAAFGSLDLVTDPCAAVVGVPAVNYSGTLVVAGDSSTSVLWHKMADTGEYGGVMPQSGALGTDTVAMIAEWIDDGAPCE